jgi:hypothetical protein
MHARVLHLTSLLIPKGEKILDHKVTATSTQKMGESWTATVTTEIEDFQWEQHKERFMCSILSLESDS